MSEKKEFFFQNLKTGEEIAVSDGKTLGRNNKSDLIINDEEISGCHIKISILGRSVYIEDQNTRNGTLINGLPAIPNQQMQVKIDDIIQIGSTELKLARDDKTTVTINSNEDKSHTSIPNLPDKNIVLSASPAQRIQEFEMVEGGLDLQIDGDVKSLLSEEDQQQQKKQTSSSNDVLIEERSKLRGLNRELEATIDRIAYRDAAEKKLDNFEENNKELLTEGPKHKDYYQKNKKEWDEVLTKIKKYKEALKNLIDVKESFGTEMFTYESYLQLAQEKSNLSLEIKDMKRENLEDKKSLIERKIEKQEQVIQDLKNQRAKDREKERILDEIKRLKEKLGE